MTALLLAGCQEELPEFAQIEAGKESLSYTQAGSTRTVKVKTSHAWTAVSSGGWLTVTPDKGGAGTYELTLTAAANTTTKARTAQVDIQVGHKISTIKVSQAQQDALGLDRNSEVVPWTAGSVEFTLSTNVKNYEVTSDASWLQPSTTKAMEEKTLVLVYEENKTYDARTAKVTVSNGSVSSEVTVTQGGRGALYFVISRDTVDAAAVRYELALMKNTVSSGLRLLDYAPWISLPPGSKAMPAEERLQLSLQPNTKTEPRKARLVIRDNSTGTLLTDTFTLVQRGRENVLLPEIKSYEAAVAGETFDIPVTASGPFEVELPEDAPWLTGSTGVQLGGTLRFTAEENTRPETRTAVVTLRLQNEASVETIITVTQAAAKVTDTDRIPRLYNLPEVGVVIETVPVNLGAFRATVDYDAGEPSGWVQDIYSSAGKLHFRLEDNGTTGKRSAVIHLTPEDKGSVEIRINQSGTDGAYIELNTPGTLASFIDFSWKGLFPASLQSIGEHAFAGAFTESESNELILSRAIALRTIGKNAFRACNTLTKLTLPNLTEIGEGAFSECYNLAGTLTLPTSLTTIGAEAFYNCKNLTGTLKLPASLSELGERAFMRCAALQGLDLSACRLTAIGVEVFKESLSSVSGTSGNSGKLTVPSGVMLVETSAFEDTGFTETDLPATLSEIGRRAFYNCRNLSVVTCHRTVPPMLDADYPAETFGGVEINTSRRTLKVPPQSLEAYKKAPSWIKATPTTGGSIEWTIEDIR